MENSFENKMDKLEKIVEELENGKLSVALPMGNGCFVTLL